MSLRLHVERGGALGVRNGAKTLAVVDTEKLEARKS
jgi:hypothetical protein